MQDAGMRKRWIARAQGVLGPEPAGGLGGPANQDTAQRLGFHPLVDRLLYQRGIVGADAVRRFLEPRLTDLPEPAALPGCDAAAGRIERALAEGQPIVVWGDYDVDGVTASAILWHVLRSLGADVSVTVPHRVDDGYGLNTAGLLSLAERRPDSGEPWDRLPLVVTVDCGVSSIEPVSAAVAAGLELIITDHHEPGDGPSPEASAVVHPRIGEASAVEAARQRGLADLAGAGVALLLAWRVAQVHCGSARLPATLKALMMEMVRLATLGTIADVAPLRDANRSLCAVGLRTLRDTQLAGLRALLSATGLLKAERDEPLEAHHVGFVLGPRLNACGRVEHASSAVRLLTDADGAEADELAAMMDRANEQRRQVERDILDQAEQQVQQHNYAAADRRALVLAGEGWHPGVVGIVASRLVERYHRPVVLLGTVNGTAKGSARSVDGVSIHAMLTRCSDRLRKFGGHAMAAGLELATDDVPALRDALVEQVNGELPADRLRADVHVDACIEAGDCGLALFEQLRRLGPFGRGNPTPRLLLRGVVLDVAGSPVGRGGDHLSLRMRSGNCVLKGIGFGMGDLAPQLPRGTRVDVVFTPKVGSWQGRPQADLHVQDVRLAERVTAAA